MANHWRELAACRGLEPNLFFPSRGEVLTDVRAVCAACPVQEPCRDFAIESERERRGVRRARRNAGTLS